MGGTCTVMEPVPLPVTSSESLALSFALVLPEEGQEGHLSCS